MSDFKFENLTQNNNYGLHAASGECIATIHGENRDKYAKLMVESPEMLDLLKRFVKKFYPIPDSLAEDEQERIIDEATDLIKIIDGH